MTIEAKICGLKTEADIDAAIAYGADYIGLVFFEPSPRHLTISRAKSLADHARGKSQIVALTVDANDQLINEINEHVRPDLFQLHGSETVDRVAAISAASACRIMKVIKVATVDDVEQRSQYQTVADKILFDAKAPPDSKLPGGNGLAFDWRILETVRGHLDYMLSGGLTADNVASAIQLTGTQAVDVSSGVERAPGEKDPARIRAFLKAAKGL
ncbi:MAG: phosphoribosylanthranilate isomerase [Hyphomicrobiaceae bacterium]